MANPRTPPPRSTPSPFSQTTSRMMPPAENVSPQQRAGTYKTETSTYFTKSTNQAQQMYTGDAEWSRVTVMLETAGPVAVSTKQEIAPVLSGRGVLLTTNIPITFTLAKGSRLWILSTSVNRVKLIVEPVPWLQQILGALMEGPGSIIKALMTLLSPNKR